MTPSADAPRPTAGPAAGPGWRGAAAAAALLALFWVALGASLASKSLTYDEVAHAAAGYAYWHFGDFRLQPENGQLPQRVAGLALVLSPTPLPPPDPAAWRQAAQWQLGDQWIYGAGQDAGRLGAAGRRLCALFAVGLGLLVWAWSRRLFGGAGALLSLLLFVLSPTVLANGALMTSDMAAALAFLATLAALWAVLGRLTVPRLLGSALACAALLLCKASALLVVPVALLLVAARLADGRPLELRLGRRSLLLASRGRQAAALAAAALLQAALVVAVLWAAYGFRYSAFAPGPEPGRFRMPWSYLLAQPPPLTSLAALHLGAGQDRSARAILAAHGAGADRWTNEAEEAMAEIGSSVLTPGQRHDLAALQVPAARPLWVPVIAGLRAHHLLPEAWLYGLADVLRRSQVRPAFWNGDFRLRGWVGFFPYTFAVKTPLAVLALLLLAMILAAGRLGRAGGTVAGAWAACYPVLPLWTFVIVYTAAALASHLNIGHRHLLPLYPALFILAGVLARPNRAAIRAAVAGLTLILAVETIATFPDYLAYFNGLVSPRSAYRHLVDSSLDWGQDLPAVRDYEIRHRVPGEAWYFSYFGSASPAYYGIGAQLLYSVGTSDAQAQADWRTVFFPAAASARRTDELLRQWPAFDVLGVQPLGDMAVAVLLRRPASLRLHPGVYVLSASMLQPVNYDLSGPWGPWNPRYEQAYQHLREVVRPLEADDPTDRRVALMSLPGGQWPIVLAQYEQYRLGRLTAFLRGRQPDDELHASILVYRVTAADLERYVDGPPPPYGPDDLALQERSLPTPWRD